MKLLIESLIGSELFYKGELLSLIDNNILKSNIWGVK